MKTVKGKFETTETMVSALLKEERVGVLTEIDIQITLKEKLNKNFRKHKILGACDPPFAFK
ncbi:DUF302 domain-containing protein [Winogradskyella thalassocola]|uniref:DUF302 domain-containing protein n=1 Tax=Winogradskyella thalassocola TaxID=262004 RepID=A0A1G8JBM7_9FLAO|nr:DUF302 domain-containing protein [Winogradskyella thalassocola]SDI28645.1 protein of unknown function DUF302 [Winogradskyella thalassocola]